MGAVGLYTHIQNNNLRSAFLLAGFPVLLLGLSYALTLGLIGFGLLPSTGSMGGDFVHAFQLMAVSAPWRSSSRWSGSRSPTSATR